MRNSTLGPLTVSALGLGCMGMSEFYGPTDEAESLRTLHRALDLGISFFDTADAYGPFSNERLLAQLLQGKRDRVTLATKFGIKRDSANPEQRSFDGSPAYVQRACDASLTRLGTTYIDMYYLHRVDPGVPIEETVGAMGRLVEQGKVRYLGLSEVSATTLHRAHEEHPITAVQSEYSLWTRDPEREVLPACRELGIGLVAYSPLGRGFLTGTLQSPDALADDDFRRTTPRFLAENFNRNLKLTRVLSSLAERRGCSPAQLALAWLLAQGADIVPIPGTKRIQYLEENAASVTIVLGEDELDALAEAFPPDVAAGTRYALAGMQTLDR
ncbi:MAG: aldo/keto reductase [Gemmatimonadaceae bacterium]